MSNPTSNQHFTIQRIPLKPPSNGTDHRITDTRTDSRVATCYDHDNARMVCDALNAYFSDETTAVPYLDSARLEWLFRNISGAEWRRLGIEYSGGMNRSYLNDAMAPVAPCIVCDGKPPIDVPCTGCGEQTFIQPRDIGAF